MTTGPSSTEDQLREVLSILADNVEAAPDAYRKVQGEWRRRERRRRLTLAILIAVVFAVADVAGLWALNHSPDQPHIVFNEPAPPPSHAPLPGRP
ncbi:hypothetical protein ACOZ38_18165 [Sphaerisporangium viridialbum]|uniref:hypothetical protein n=1 Tax=Sphaerisporangium viridialbum TaxID=46189 RepID=UPI003C711B57